MIFSFFRLQNRAGSDHSRCAPEPSLVLFDRGNQQVGILGTFGEPFIMTKLSRRIAR